MAITNVAEVGQQGMGSTARVTSYSRVSLDLDASYPNGGYALDALVKAAIGAGVTLMAIQQASPAGGYKLWWDRANGKLLVWRYPTAVGPSTVVPDATNLAGVTALELDIWWV